MRTEAEIRAVIERLKEERDNPQVIGQSEMAAQRIQDFLWVLEKPEPIGVFVHTPDGSTRGFRLSADEPSAQVARKLLLDLHLTAEVVFFRRHCLPGQGARPENRIKGSKTLAEEGVGPGDHIELVVLE